MKKFAIFGNPVKHSKSPAMHNYFFSTLNINARYEKVLLEKGEDIKTSFEQNAFAGANVTVPFKEDAFRLCDETFDIAKKANSVNTIINQNGKLLGYNTDGDGFWYSIKEDFGEDIQTALVLGAGGTAKSIAHTLKNNNIQTTILNRSTPKLQYFQAHDFLCQTHDTLEIKNYDLIINTTSAGLNDQSLPLEYKKLKLLLSKSKFAYDVIYNKQTPFISLAKELNLKTQNGKNMLIYQGVYASLLFMQNKFSFEQTAKLLKLGFDKKD